jgi:hypothetical protein
VEAHLLDQHWRFIEQAEVCVGIFRKRVVHEVAKDNPNGRHGVEDRHPVKFHVSPGHSISSCKGMCKA